ncbi:unnamed protein product, partial [Mesorhabditis belari]|uniref:Uncharacterized protein n=1 Tax=Mesorhabditis belari TaxID=2138241 RepID=A0AAF3FPL2_9BILA
MFLCTTSSRSIRPSASSLTCVVSLQRSLHDRSSVPRVVDDHEKSRWKMLLCTTSSRSIRPSASSLTSVVSLQRSLHDRSSVPRVVDDDEKSRWKAGDLVLSVSELY